jgi:hypothetical protein
VPHPSSKFPVPLYLNQTVVFDLLAMMEGGISQLQRIRITESNQENRDNKIAGDIGVKNAFALLGVTLGGERSRKEQTGTVNEKTEERVHTPNSLFAKVRDNLHAQKLISTSRLQDTATGSFVEFKATLRLNPLIDGFTSFIIVQDMAAIFADEVSPPTKQGGRPASKDPNKAIVEKIRKFLNQLNSGDTFDILGECQSEEETRIVLTLNRSFMSDITLSGLAGGEYTVLGKITKVIPRGSDEIINLLSKTSLGRVHGPLLDTIKEALDNIRKNGIFIPEVITEVEGPAVQVIPIAVFA